MILPPTFCAIAPVERAAIPRATNNFIICTSLEWWLCHTKNPCDFWTSVQLLGFRHFYWVFSMHLETSFGASDISFPSIAKSKVNAPETPSPLKQPTPSTSASNIYPALKNIAPLLLSRCFLFRQYCSSDVLGTIRPVKHSKRGVNICVVSWCDKIQE